MRRLTISSFLSRPIASASRYRISCSTLVSTSRCSSCGVGARRHCDWNNWVSWLISSSESRISFDGATAVSRPRRRQAVQAEQQRADQQEVQQRLTQQTCHGARRTVGASVAGNEPLGRCACSAATGALPQVVQHRQHRRVLLPHARLHQRLVHGHRVPILPGGQVRRDGTGVFRMGVDVHPVRLDHALARDDGVGVALHRQRQQRGLDLRRRARAVAQVLLLDPGPCVPGRATRAARSTSAPGSSHRPLARPRPAAAPARRRPVVAGNAQQQHIQPAACGELRVGQPRAQLACVEAAAWKSASPRTVRRRARRARSSPPAAGDFRAAVRPARHVPATASRSTRRCAGPRPAGAATPPDRCRSHRAPPSRAADLRG